MIKDMIIVGGGPAGYAAALAAAGSGSVLLVERDALGGTCTNRGCIPSKFYLARSEQLAPGSAAAMTSTWERLRNHKDNLVRGLVRAMGESCASRGVEVVRGQGRLTEPDVVAVTSLDGGVTRFRARRIILAAGSAPAELPGLAPDGKSVITSTEALDLKELPSSLVVVGSGAVGAEFAFIFRRFGVAVTIVEAAGRLFPQEDPDVGRLFLQVYARQGIDVVSGDPVTAIDRGATGTAVHLRSGRVIEAEKVLLGVGRKLLSGDLGCPEAGVALGSRGEILVDEDLRTSQPHIRAAGDITGRMLLAHAATYQGEYAARRALDLPFPRVPYESIPWATFTVPEVASVGLSLEAAIRKGVDGVAATTPMMGNIKARIDRSADGLFKLVAERATGRVIGGTVVGAHASEIIHGVAVAIHGRLTVNDLRGFCFLHPSISESIADVAIDLQRTIFT